MALQKYFIALVPPEPLLSAIYRIKEDIAERYHTKGALRSPAHITLHMPFEYEQSKEQKLADCLGQFRFRQALDIELRNFNCFEPRVIFIDVAPDEALQALQKQLVQHVKTNLHLYNQDESLRGFHPHLTIAFRDLKKPAFYQAWEEFRQKTFEASFPCTELCLLRHDGAQWQVHQRFPFTA